MFVNTHKTRCNIFFDTMSVYRVVVCLIVFHIQELSTYDDCMIWDILGDNLIFTCTIRGFSEPVTLCNNLGTASATCSFEHVTNRSIKCALQNDSLTVSVDVKNKAVKFKVNEIKSKYVDGTWSCSQGNRKLTCNVSKLKGIVEDTNIYVQGELSRINNALKVSLRCFACRVSRGNNAEFLINGRSELSITYDPVSGKCTDQIGQCNPEKCYCVSTRNEFNATFPFHEKSHMNYSCGMQFIDKESSMIFSKIANLHFNGTDFHVMNTDTNILKPKAPNKDTDLETENVTATLPTIIEVSHEINAGILIAIFSTITVLVLIIAVYFCHRKQHRKELQNKTFGEDESDFLLRDLEPTSTVSTYTSMRNDAGNYFGPVLSTEAGTCTDNEPTSTVSAYTSMKNDAGDYFGSQSEETMTEQSYSDTERKNKEVEDLIKSGTIKRCILCSLFEKLTKALYWCLDCEDGFCVQCTKIHEKMSDHNLIEIVKLPNNYSMSFYCTEHTHLGLYYFCINHDELCCLDCRQSHHSMCTNIEHIDFVSKACRDSQAFKDFEDRLNVSCNILNISFVMLSCNIKNIDKDCSLIEDLISISKETEPDPKGGDTFVYQKIQTELQKAKHDCLLALQTDILEAERLKASIDDQKRLFDLFEKHASNKLLFLLIHSSNRSLSEKNAKIQDFSENIKHHSVQYIGYEVGRIEVLKTKQVILPEKKQGETNVQAPIGPAIVSFDGELMIYTPDIQDSMTVSNNGFLLVCTTTHLVVVVLFENWHREVHIKLCYTPKDISIIPETDTAVLTCQHANIIQFVDINKPKEISTAEVDGSSNCSIACSPQCILVVDKRKILILDHDGKRITTLKIDVALRSLSYFNERLYFIENDSNVIRCIEMNGKNVFCSQLENVDTPITVIPNKEGHVFVLDKGPIKLHKLSAYGRYIPLEIKGNVDLKNQRSMCFNKDHTKLYVLNKGGSSICTFNIEKWNT